jgi:drug/metabolite transporter (DMT)-like permease
MNVKRFVPHVLYCLSVLLMGPNWYVTRLCLQGYEPLTAAALRFMLAASIFIAVCAAGRAGVRPTREELGWLALSGVLNAGQYALFYFALLGISGGLAGVIYGTVQLFVALIAVVSGTERVSAASLCGGLLALGGLAFIYWDRLALSSSQASGVLFMFAAVVLSAFSFVILKHHGRRVTPVMTTTIFLTVSALLLGAGALVLERDAFDWPSSVKPTLALLYLGVVGSAAGFGVYFAMLKRTSLMAATSITFILPVFALCIDWVAREPLRMSGAAYFGVALTLSGVLVPFLAGLRARPRAVVGQAELALTGTRER